MNSQEKKTLLGEMVIPGIAFVFGISFFLQCRDAPKVALFWPLIIVTVCGGLWLAVVFQFIIKKKAISNNEAKPKTDTLKKASRPVMILVSTLGYLFVVPHFGFSLSNFAFMLVAFKGLGSIKWSRNLLVAAIITVFLHIALIMFMKLSLPRLDLGWITI